MSLKLTVAAPPGQGALAAGCNLTIVMQLPILGARTVGQGRVAAFDDYHFCAAGSFQFSFMFGFAHGAGQWSIDLASLDGGSNYHATYSLNGAAAFGGPDHPLNYAGTNHPVAVWLTGAASHPALNFSAGSLHLVQSSQPDTGGDRAKIFLAVPSLALLGSEAQGYVYNSSVYGA